MYINKHLKPIYNSIDNIHCNCNNNDININNPINNIKLKYSSSTKNYKNDIYAILPQLIDQEKKPIFHHRNNNISIEKENSKNDFPDELDIINALWDELGITEEYKFYFNQTLQSFNYYNSKIIFLQEKESLQKFKTSLMKLKKEISQREFNITNLKKIIKIIDAKKEANSEEIKEIINLIKSLRLNAVNIVIYINRVRELGFYYYFQGKWDLTKIKNEYMYDNNYLLQMNNDLFFLKNSYISNYINFSENPCDAFLTNCSQFIQENNNFDKNKIIIPISDDLMQLIEQSIFFIFQDKILDNIYLKNFLTMNNQNNSINSNRELNRSNSMKLKIKKDLKRPITAKGILSYGNNNGINYNNYKKKDFNGFIRKNENNIFNDIDKRLLNTYKYGNAFENNNLFQISANIKEPKINLIPESTRIKNRVKNQEDNNHKNNSDQKKIKIIHELVSSMNSSSGKNRTYVNNINNSNNIINERMKKELKNELHKLNKKTDDIEKFKVIKSIFN